MKMDNMFNNKRKLNRKGDIPVTILVIGVFGVCTLALLSFVYSSSQLQKAMVGLDVLDNANIQIESHNLPHLYLEEKVTKFSPGLSFDWFRKKIVFSVEYTRP